MVRDEADIIQATVGHMLAQVDHVLVADNLSRDCTPEILGNLVRRFPERIDVVTDDEPGYYQSRKMTRLARAALVGGATWVVPFDADEIWVGSLGTVAETLRAHEADFGIVTAELYDHVATAKDPKVGDMVDRLPWRRTYPLDLPKVACRATDDLTIEQGNHNATYSRVPAARTPSPRLTVHHYPYRSLEQFIRKVRNGADAYAAAPDLGGNVGRHWREWGDFTDDQLRALFHEYYYREEPELPITHPGDPKEYPPLIKDVPRR